MKIFIKEEFDYEKNLGKELKCVEMVTNDKEEISKEVYVLEENENQEEICEKMNRENKDNHYKYISITYTVFEDYLQCI